MRKFNIDFLKSTRFFFPLSALLVVLSIFSIVQKGFNYGVDFSGGTELRVQFNGSVAASDIRGYLSSQKVTALIQGIGEKNEFLIRMNVISNKDFQNFLTNMKVYFAKKNIIIRGVESVGPQIGGELKRKSILALVYSLILILIYIGLRFDYEYAPGAVFCLFHDVIITLGIFSLFQKEVNLQTLAAVLTIIGYSLNDTIIVFDRIRENIPLFREKSFSWIANRSLNNVLSRSLITSFTTLMAIGAMFILSDGVIEEFAFTLGIGVLIGTYSSVYIAAPLVIAARNLKIEAVALSEE